MNTYPKALEEVIKRFSKFPGVGRKTAERFAFHLLRSPIEEVRAFAQAISNLKEGIRRCKVCNNLSEDTTCRICADPNRDQSSLCVVEEPKDVLSIEKSGEFRGIYHVLLGVISPLDGVGPDDLKLDDLVKRVQGGSIKEVIIATSLDSEGEVTALYIQKLLKPFNVRLTRIASGISVGSDLEYADQATLAKALEGRREMT